MTANDLWIAAVSATIVGVLLLAGIARRGGWTL